MNKATLKMIVDEVLSVLETSLQGNVFLHAAIVLTRGLLDRALEGAAANLTDRGVNVTSTST